jgi:hypothetical protein
MRRGANIFVVLVQKVVRSLRRHQQSDLGKSSGWQTIGGALLGFERIGQSISDADRLRHRQETIRLSGARENLILT